MIGIWHLFSAHLATLLEHRLMNLAYLHRLIFNGSAPSQKGGPVLGKIERRELDMIAEILVLGQIFALLYAS